MIAHRIIPTLLMVAVGAIIGLGAHGQFGDDDDPFQIHPEELEDQHVRAAIAAIVEELYERKNDSTFWDPPRYDSDFNSKQRGGWTALAVLSLLYAGETYQDPRLRDAVAWLEELDMAGTYAVAIRASVWAKLPPRFGEALIHDKDWLIEGFSERAGGWNYGKEPMTTRRDNSITQYGTLGLWEAAKRQARIENRYWRMLEERFIDMQLADGGWNYTGDGPATGSMSAAGLTVLFITQDFLHAHEQVDLRRNRDTKAEAGIRLGLDWMSKNFSPDENPNRHTNFYYYLYGVERVGLASGYKYFGDHDWFREGAAELIRRLCHWDEASQTMETYDRLAGDARAGEIRTEQLAFSLMFLSRGRVPVAINKLQHEATRWNNRPRDVANLVQWLVQQSESGLNWQIVDMNAEPGEWLDAPLLYFATDASVAWIARHDTVAESYIEAARRHERQRASGEIAPDAEPPALNNAKELHKLKRYLDLGGMLFVNVDGANRRVAEQIELAGSLIYPNYEWRTLAEDHPLYTLLRPVEGVRRELRGLSNGVRELIIVSPDTDFSAILQARQPNREDELNTLSNLYVYASEMNRGRPRLEQSVLQRDEDAMATDQMTIVHALHQANWNAEPLALEAFSTWMWNERALHVDITEWPLGRIDELEDSVALVIATGTQPHEFTEPERDAIRTFTDRGGIILFETAGGVGDFSASAEEMCRDLFGGSIRSLRRHPIITGDGLHGADRMTRAEYRPFSFEIFGGRELAPRLRGIMDGEHISVLLSREDLSNALLDQPVWGVSGYATASARELLANIVRYSMAQRDVRHFESQE